MVGCFPKTWGSWGLSIALHPAASPLGSCDAHLPFTLSWLHVCLGAKVPLVSHDLPTCFEILF